MRRLILVVALVTASCGGGAADSTTSTPAPTTLPSTTTTTPPATTSSTSSTTTSSTTTTSTTTTTLTAGFVSYSHAMFELAYPDAWSENPEFPGFGVGFIEDHSALALPPTTFDVFLEQQEPSFDLDAHVQRVIDELAAFVADFRVLQSGEGEIDGVRSLWFEYADDINGFPVVIREEVALRDNVTIGLTLISPEEFFAFDASQVETVIASIRFT